jgi:lysophospholipase L1-like esterase
MIGVADLTIPRKPNVVLINWGTNDADPSNGQDIPNTRKRVEDILNHIYDNIDGVTIILSTLLSRKDANNANVELINPTYRALAQRFADNGKRIVLTELEDGFLEINTDFWDNIHSNERGVAKLAAVRDYLMKYPAFWSEVCS